MTGGEVLEMADLLIEDLRTALQQGRVVIIVGTGVSVGATANAKVASWTGMLEDGVDRCEQVARPTVPAGWGDRMREQIASGDLGELLSAAENVTERLGGRGGGEYRRWLRETVGQLRSSDAGVLEALRDLGGTLATTNYDGLLEDLTGQPPVTWREPELAQRIIRGDDPGVLHLHGYWQDPQSVVLGIRSYEAVLSDKHAQAMQRALAATHTFLFVGFGEGLADPNFGALRRWMGRLFKGGEYRHFRLAKSDQVAELQAQHAQDERVFVIDYGLSYAHLAPFLRSLAPAQAPSSRPSLRPGKPSRQLAETATEDSQHKVDFFISYAATDRAWAEWIAWTLEDHGHATILQAWDFRPGGKFVEDVNRATTLAERTIAVLSPAYLASPFAEAEWRSALVKDPVGRSGALLPIRVEPVDPPELLRTVLFIDLVGLDETSARERLLEGVRRERVKPSAPPASPFRMHPDYPRDQPQDQPQPVRKVINLRAPSLEEAPDFVDRVTIFIVHGHDSGIKEAIARLLERCVLDADIAILHEQPNQGRAIIEKFEHYATTASYAVIIMTSDDRGSEASKRSYRPRARQNVLLELGYFLGKLGRGRVAVLYEEKVEMPSDILGVGYIPIDSSGAWRLNLVREIDAAGLPVDFRRVV